MDPTLTATVIPTENSKVIQLTASASPMADHKWKALLGGLGFAMGIAYAFRYKSGFWKGWGIAIVGGIAGSGIGYGIDQFSKK